MPFFETAVFKEMQNTPFLKNTWFSFALYIGDNTETHHLSGIDLTFLAFHFFSPPKLKSFVLNY